MRIYSLAFLSVAVLVCDVGCGSEEDEGEGPPAQRAVVHVVGYDVGGAGVSVPCHWEDGVRTELSVASAARGAQATSISISDPDIYIAGFSNATATTATGCYWKNGARTDLGSTLPFGRVCVHLAGSDVYVSGNQGDASTPTIRVAGYWLNGTRVHLSDAAAASAIGVLDGDVYVSGYSIAGSYPRACFWRNGSRAYLPTIDEAYPSGAGDLLTTSTEVILVGMTQRAGMNVPCCWRNWGRNDLSVIDSARSGSALALAVSGGELHIAGYSETSAGVKVPCHWQNGSRTDLPRLDAGRPGEATGVAVSGDDVYVSGYTTSSAGVYVPCYWKNGARTDLPVSDSARNALALAVAITLE